MAALMVSSSGVSYDRSDSPSRFPSVLDGLRAECARLNVRVPRWLAHQLAPAAMLVDRISLRRIIITPGLAKAIAGQLASLPALSLIDFDGSELSYAALEHITDALCAMPPVGTSLAVTLRMTGVAPGPRSLRLLRRLIALRPDVTVENIGGVELQPGDTLSLTTTPTRWREVDSFSPHAGRTPRGESCLMQQSIIMMNRDPGTSPAAGSGDSPANASSAHENNNPLRRLSTRPFVELDDLLGEDGSFASNDPEEERRLELLMAEQLERLSRPVDELHRRRVEAKVAALEALETEARQHCEHQHAEQFDAIEAARAFETPFRKPEFDESGPLCSPARGTLQALRTLAAVAAGDVASDDADAHELLRLKADMFAINEALERRGMTVAGGSVRVTSLRSIDGRPARLRRLLPGESLVAAAQRFAVQLRELEMLNSEAARAAWDVPEDVKQSSLWVLVPVSLDRELQEALDAEHAAAVRLASFELRQRSAANVADAADDCDNLIFHDLSEARSSSASDGRPHSSDLEQLRESLAARRREREAVQASLRDLEVRMFEKRRDGWLRFLKLQELLARDAERAFVRELENFDDVMRQIESMELNERIRIDRRIAAEQLPPEEVELRALQARARALLTRCSPSR